MLLDPEGFYQRVCEVTGESLAPDIAKKLGISKHAVYLWQQGKMPGLKGLKNVAKLAESTNTSLEWLLTGTGSRYKEVVRDFRPKESKNELSVYFGEAEHQIIDRLAKESGRDKADQVRELVLEALIARGQLSDQVEKANLIFFGEHVPKLVQVKLLGVIAAGKPIEALEYAEMVLVPETFILPNRGNFVLKVKGDSMQEEGILDGDLIICYESPTAYNGQKVVALIDNTEATLKKFYREGNRIRLEAANPSYKPMVFDADRVHVLGIVVGIYRPM